MTTTTTNNPRHADAGMRFTGPDFLCIGAQRSGSTWTHRLLQAHPDVWVTPIKELHYFNDPSRTRYWRHLRKRLMSKGFPSRWDAHYFLGRPGDRWYADLFRQAKSRGLTAGELTPTYALLDAATFQRIKGINPEVKIVFLMRNPIERSWSNFQNNKRKHGLRPGVPLLQAAVESSTKPGPLAGSLYIRTLETLDAVFDPRQVFLGFFDDLRDRPEWFARQLFTFLGVDASDAASMLPKGAVNAVVAGGTIPDEYRKAMAPYLVDETRRLADRLGGHALAWQAQLDALI